jgi:uncharacterized protein
MEKSEANSICKSVSFISDGYKLRGDLQLPENAMKPPVVIGSHGLFATRQSPKQAALAVACNHLGMAYFRFDHRGCGESEGGPFEQCSFESRIRDILNAFEFVTGLDDTGDDIALFGSSLGGAAACRAFSAIRPAAIVVFAAPTASQPILDSTGEQDKRKYPDYFFENISFDNGDMLSKLSNILIFHGDRDETVPLSEARKIHGAAGEPKKLIVQRQGDHRMSDEAHQREFVRIAAEWFEKGFERKRAP